MERIYYIIVFFFLSCNPKENIEKPTSDLSQSVFEAYSEIGSKIYSSSCIANCETDSSFNVTKYYSASGKLILIEEIKNKKSKTYFLGYDGDDPSYKSIAGYYLFKEYINNSLYGKGDIKFILFDKYIEDSIKFKKDMELDFFRNFKMTLDSSELKNITWFISH